MNKRTFLQSLAVTGLAASGVGRALAALPAGSPLPAPDAGGDFWDGIRAGYDLDPARINLENGYFCIQPREVLQAQFEHARRLNRAGSYMLRTEQADEIARLRAQLAEFAGCDAGELIITRNTTESLDTVISGIDWKPGDEAVMAAQDYASMLEMFRQEVRRHGIVNRIISLPLHPGSDEEIVSLYERALSPRTRLLMVCHMVNVTGQVLPVKKICAMARAHNVPVMVDGAHSFAHLDFRVRDLDCDFFGTSLHKWLSAPLGLGMLYVRRSRIAAAWPLLGDDGYPRDDVRKLNHTGTHPLHAMQTIPDALRFHQRIGSQRKEARLRSLQEYWTSQARKLPGVTLNTPVEPSRACAIANVAVAGITPTDLASLLLEKFRIWTVAIDSESTGVRGVRVTPAIFTSTAELDALVAALSAIATRHGGQAAKMRRAAGRNQTPGN
ncbi:MAG: aminotransferase class [Verrucomicrobia bacterium]|nr:aminotransferase class [Verrucomicrobiota bacterium]